MVVIRTSLVPVTFTAAPLSETPAARDPTVPSDAPVTTGTPVGMPVATEASLVIFPATSWAFRNSGRMALGISKTLRMSSLQSRLLTSSNMV